MSDRSEYVVDVLVPVAIAVSATDAEAAASHALERAEDHDLYNRVARAIDGTPFVISDSPFQTEVGVA